MTGLVPVGADAPSEGRGFGRGSWVGPLAGLIASAALAAGCGGGGGTVKPAATSATVPPPATTAPPEQPPARSTTVPGTAPPPGSATGAGSGGSEPIRVPAAFIFTRAGRVDPPTITIPALVPVELTLASRDGRGHTLVLRAGGHAYALRVPAGGRASTRIAGLPAGRYPLAAVGGGARAALIVGGQVGP